MTTIIDFTGDLSRKALSGESRRPVLETLDRRRVVFKDHCYTDFAFHYIIAGKAANEAVGQIREAIEEGIGSFKIFSGVFSATSSMSIPPSGEAIRIGLA